MVTADNAATLTKEAIARHKAGDTDAAACLLVQAVQDNPTYEMAWLWLSSCLSAPGEKRYCLDQALIANPQSAPARTGLAQLGDVPAVLPSALAAVPTPPELTEAAKPVRRYAPLKTLAIICAVGLSIVFWFWLYGGNRFVSSPTVYQPVPIDAFVMCKQFVTDRLKAPATAVFPTYGDDGTQTDQVSSVQFRARGYVDSQNSFGANVRTHYTCTISSTGGKNWHLDDLKTDP